uniref:Uncharacterized protein n=1 Tax=Anguilla anguilla TaxID=7936 RepID=A0A0E9XX01_ANGAN
MAVKVPWFKLCVSSSGHLTTFPTFEWPQSVDLVDYKSQNHLAQDRKRWRGLVEALCTTWRDEA